MAVNALVTGGGGFLGRAIVERLLARGDRVAVLGRRRYPDLEALGVEGIACDLADAEGVARACRGRDVVFHVAARAGVWGPLREYRLVNLEGTRHVLEGCRRQGVGRLVYTSSPSVVFDGREHLEADESLPYAARHLTAYSRTKAEAEQLVLASREPLTVSLRPHLIWGPGDPHLLPRLVARARAGRLLQVGEGTTRVTLTYRDHAAAAHLLACDRLEAGSPLAGRAYFVGDAEPVALWPWIRRLLRRLGEPGVRGRVPRWVAWIGGGVCEALWTLLRLPGEPPMTRFLALQLGLSHTYDLTAARRDLGYRPWVAPEEGLERLAAWWAARQP